MAQGLAERVLAEEDTPEFVDEWEGMAKLKLIFKFHKVRVCRLAAGCRRRWVAGIWGTIIG